MNASMQTSTEGQSPIHGPVPFIRETQRVQAKLYYWSHPEAPASGIRISAGRRATSDNRANAPGSAVSSVEPDLSNGGAITGIQHITLDCGSGDGEPCIWVESLGTNAGAEQLYLLGTRFTVVNADNSALPAGWLYSWGGRSGLTTVEIMRLLGCTDTRPSGSLTAATAGSDVAAWYNQTCSYGGVDGPDLWIPIAVYQNQNTSSSAPSVDYRDGGLVGNPAYEANAEANMRLMIAQMRAISAAGSVADPLILWIGTLKSPTKTDAEFEAIAAMEERVARSEGIAYWDGWASTKDLPAAPYYLSQHNQSGGDGVHYSVPGAEDFMLTVQADLMRAGGLDPGHRLSGFGVEKLAAGGSSRMSIGL